ncbi:ABC-2 transporter permease [Inediibacterium massiliense]|uniref:ABC-2 transporter permease n=1 Tax=Inediibacterium massiliense TaxID=1658111 RepID=UPI0006B4E4E6|nr:ABC-2 transporter permease [Inediibacterium massiliense]
MYNLFVKDFYLIKKRVKFIIFYGFIMFFIFNAQGNHDHSMAYTAGICMVGYTMMMYTTAYDDKNNSEVLLNSLPISRSNIVLSRYLSIFIFAGVGVLSMMIAGFILKSFHLLHVSKMIEFEDLFGAIFALCFISFLYLPIYFKYGYIKAKMFNLILFAIAFGVPMLIGTLLKETQKPLWIDKGIQFLSNQTDFVVGLFFIMVIITLGIISFAFSIMIYKRREF